MAGVLRIVAVSVLCFFSIICCSHGKVKIKSKENQNQVLTEENWQKILVGEWMVKFFAPWCPACKHVVPIWVALASKSIQLGIRVGEVDVTKQSALSGQFMITALPTVYHVKDGVFRKYEGARSFEEFAGFIKNEKWKDVEAIPSWKAPGSFVMKAVGILFKISTMLKDAHELLTEYYGLPAWASYTIFGVSTIAVGLILGLLIVLVTENVMGAPGEPATDRSPSSTEDQEPGDKKAEAKDEEEESESESEEDTSTVRKRVVKTTKD